MISPKSVLAKGLIIISNEAKFLAGERLKIRPEEGEKESGRGKQRIQHVLASGGKIQEKWT